MSLLKDVAHKQIPLDHILSATSNFSDENLIREGGFGRIYKGQLLYYGETIDIVARRLNPKYGQGDKEFFTEISMLSSLKHPNLVSFIGFCDENEEKIIINKYEANSSLDKYLSDPKLTWVQRLKICVGVGRALSYLYYEEGRSFSVIHRNIKSSKILLDHKWEPKLCGFELSLETQKDGHLLTEVSGTHGYVDPAYEKTGIVSHKSDMFSFGVVLFEVLCGRRAFIPNENEEQSLLFTLKSFEHLDIPENGLLHRLAKSHYENRKLNDIIDPDLRSQMHHSYQLFSKTAYKCLNEDPAKRPNVDAVFNSLEKALHKYDHGGAQYFAEDAEDTSSNHWKALPMIAGYPSLCRNPPVIEKLPFLFDNTPTNLANGNIMYFSLNEFANLQIPLEDILSATKNFSDENILVHGGVGKLYKGQLKRHRQLIDIVARRLEVINGQGDIELWTEISMLSSLKHKHLVSIVGFCAENDEKIIIYEHTGHGCLDQYLSDPALTWSQRLQICLGVANALAYIHYDVVHGDISSSNVLIDNDWEAKIFGFGLSTKYPGNWEHHLLFSHYFEKSTYKDPVYTNTRGLTPKYDVYSFGVLLYNVLCGEKPMYKNYGAREKLDEMIDPDLKKQMDKQSLNTLSKLADNCLNQQRMQRPSMDQIVKELENVLELPKKPEKIEHSTTADEAIISTILTKEKMKHMKISGRAIKSAINKFNSYIGSGGYGKVYKVELDHLDIENISSSDWKSKNELPKKRSIVAIKSIINQQAGEEGFHAEIETLASCKHPNIVSLLGFSSEDHEMFLVFEYALNGSVADCLIKNTMAKVVWAKRIQICLGVAHGLNYLHANLDGKRMILHRDVKSANILLDDKWNAKVADFGLSKFNPAGNTLMSAVVTKHIVGTEVYLDPEYISTGIYAKTSDIYSFGVVLFEILSGRMAYDSIYKVGNENGLAVVARQRYVEGTIKELIDPNLMEDDNEHVFTLNKGPNQKSLEAFTKIAYQCLSETQNKRPKIEEIIKQLEAALHFQGKTMVLNKFRLSDIVSATKNFATECCIGVGAYGMMYNAKLDHYDTKSLSEIEGNNGGELRKETDNVTLKRILNREDRHGKQGFFEEIDLLSSFKHPNILSLLGISSENRELIVIYKGDLKGSLHDCLRNLRTMAKLTWAKRIQMSLDIAHGVNYLQTSAEDKQRIMQFDVNSANILLDAKWRAKIACFWLSTLNSASVDAGKMQLYPEYIKIEKLKKESEIYSLGVILFEILCGRLQYDEIYYAENEKGLPVMARRCFDEGTILNKMIDPNLKEEIDENICILNEEVNEDSFNVFLKIAYGCCALSEADRPSMKAILEELEKALNIQAEHLEGMKAQIVEKKKTLEHLKIPLINISLATENFSESYLIGIGGYAGVYKAELYNFSGMTIEEKINSVFPKRHIAVAIKRISYRGDGYVEQGFMAELEILSHCNHPNIVSLIGFCDEDREKILVLEYVSNGSLADYLKDLDNKPNLTWAQRLQICLDIACGICYLHSSTEDKQTIIHRDIKSENILLSENMVAKICDFGLSKLNHAYQQFSSVHTNHIAGTQMYLDPDYGRTGRLKKESDIYSFGVVLLEILCGKVAYDHAFMSEAANGLAQVARKCFKNGTIKQIIDSRMKEDDEINFRLNGEVPISQDSLDTFSKIAYQCLAKSQNQRPTMQTVIAELKKARYFQTHKRDKLQVLPKDIQLMTENFSDHKCTGEGGYWKRYKGELVTANGCITVVAKRFDSKYDKQRQHFLKELEILFKCKHDNIVSLVGYCQYMDEKIIVYEHPSNGRLSEHLDNANITWMKRLKISIDVACGLQFLHTFGVIADIPIIHGTIKSASILLDDVWVAKLSDLELSLNSLDDGYEQSGYLKQRLDIYSLGVVLLELLCGKFAWVEGNEDQSHSLVPLAKQCFKKGKLEELVFEGIKEQINSSSLETYVAIALRCLKDDGDERPEASEVLIQLQKAAELQEDFDIWEPKLPKDYQEIIRFSEMDNNAMKKDIYNKLRKGLLLRYREVCLSLGTGGERHYMISAKKFSYKNRWALNWRRIPESRFGNAAEMSNLSNLKIKINIRTLFLSLGVNYGVHLIFRFFGPRKISSKLMYVNLMYKIGSDTFRAYCATWRDEEWMKIELCQFVYNQEDTNFEVLLENFSSYYCGRGAVYIEGIEFRVIEKVNGKEIEKTNEVQQVFKLKSDGDDQVQQLPSDSDEILRSSPDSKPKKLISQNEVNIKKQFMLSAKEVLHDSSNVKHFHLKHSSESRFQEVIELQPQQVLRINCKIQSQMLSKDTEYSCYLVFKLSEKCLGLHCPVKVRALPCRKRKEAKHIYFRSPNPWNLHNDIHIPGQREDGWMEVNAWNINKNHKLQNDCFWVNLKLTSYEGTMAGLIVCGLEIRPM